MHQTLAAKHVNVQGMFAAAQATKLAESSKMLAEEDQARHATSVLHKRDLVLKLRKVKTAPCATQLCFAVRLQSNSTLPVSVS